MPHDRLDNRPVLSFLSWISVVRMASLSAIGNRLVHSLTNSCLFLSEAVVAATLQAVLCLDSSGSVTKEKALKGPL